jgi:hypothetical protein
MWSHERRNALMVKCCSPARATAQTGRDTEGDQGRERSLKSGIKPKKTAAKKTAAKKVAAKKVPPCRICGKGKG